MKVLFTIKLRSKGEQQVHGATTNSLLWKGTKLWNGS